MAARAIGQRPFNIGQKIIYLPNFTVTLIRTPRLPPTYARFIVPLRMNKLDIRDYLYHAYGVTVLSVRSFVQQQKVRHDKPDAERPRPRRWFRPRAIKRMTVEMERPFVWPEEPEDFEAWDKSTKDSGYEFAKAQQEQMQPEAQMKPAPGREAMAEQAKALLEGRTRLAMWEDDGPEVEVETETNLEMKGKKRL